MIDLYNLHWSSYTTTVWQEQDGRHRMSHMQGEVDVKFHSTLDVDELFKVYNLHRDNTVVLWKQEKYNITGLALDENCLKLRLRLK